MTNNKMSQQQIEGKRHESSRMRLSQRASDQSNGKWAPTPFRMGNLGFKPFKPLIALFIVILILTSFIRCSSTLATTYDENGTKVITKTVYVPTYYPTSYHSFYGVGGLGYYSNFYRPVYRQHRARPIVRTRNIKPRRTVTPVRRVTKPRVTRPIRTPRTGTTGNTVTRTNKGRRQ